MRAVSLALLILVAASCQPAQRTAQEVAADLDAIRADYQSLANADDAAGVAALYTEDAVFTDTHGNVHNGREAIRGYFEAGVPVTSDLAIKTTDVVSHGDMVAGYGTYSQTAQGPEGEVSMSGMWQTVSMYQPDGSLKIVLHQSMLPSEPPSM